MTKGTSAEPEGDTQLDSGDMSQDIFNREMDASIGEQVERRLGEVERALQKIEEGTYGLSDDSGEPYPGAGSRPCPKRSGPSRSSSASSRERRPPV